MAPTVHTPPINTYVPLQTITLGSSASSVTFSSIPASDANGTYKDLVLIARYVPTSYTQIRFNSDSSNIYNCVHMSGSGSSAISGSYTAPHIDPGNGIGDLSGNDVQFILQLQDYSVTDKHKSGLIRIDNSARYTQAQAVRYATTSAITTINLIQLGVFNAGSTFSLYALHG